MKIIEVNDAVTRKEFLKVPKILYKNDKNWTCPLDIEIENIFNPNKNLCFKNGEAIRWILKDDNGKLIGRIAAFYDKTKAYKNDQPTGGMGFFECINNKEAAFLLFDTGKEWLKSKGMEAMDGPINFGENLTYWGLLIDGFVRQGYGMQYNFPYYRELFEDYGFQIFHEQYCFHDDLNVPYPERQVRFGEHIGSKPNYSFRHFEMKKSEEYIRLMVDAYNEVWSNFLENYSHLGYDEFYAIFKDAKPILKEKYIWFAYDGDKMVAFMVGFPDVNQILNKMNGKLNLWNKLKFLYLKSVKTIDRCRLIVSGALPEYQRTGIIIPLYLHFSRTLKKNGIREIELSWVGDYNKVVISLYSHFETIKAKTHATYRYLFDRNKEFKRFEFYLGANVRENKKE